MSRAIVLVLDSFGIGASADAHRYHNAGANTLGHIAKACAAGQANRAGVRNGRLHIPHLLQLGLGHAAQESAGATLPALTIPDAPTGFYGYAKELSLGKDTPSGHWEMMGVPVLFDWGYFPETIPTFPDHLIQRFIQEAQLPGILGNCHASGTTIIDIHGAEHIKTGKPIVYTSGDSVFQIACHEQYFGLERLYEICEIARRLVDEYQVGRVIARPFIGEPGNFVRTGNRRDLATPPPHDTLLDILFAMGREVIAIGKIGDIFAHRGMTQILKANGTDGLLDATLQAVKTAPSGSLVFSNFVDFDTLFGHRRDVVGYAHELERFDARLPELFQCLQADDLVIFTADHGCDPTWEGSDHTREHIPVVGIHSKLTGHNVGLRQTFADIGQTIATHLGTKKLAYGTSFL